MDPTQRLCVHIMCVHHGRLDSCDFGLVILCNHWASVGVSNDDQSFAIYWVFISQRQTLMGSCGQRMTLISGRIEDYGFTTVFFV